MIRWKHDLESTIPIINYDIFRKKRRWRRSFVVVRKNHSDFFQNPPFFRPKIKFMGLKKSRLPKVTSYTQWDHPPRSLRCECVRVHIEVCWLFLSYFYIIEFYTVHSIRTVGIENVGSKMLRSFQGKTLMGNRLFLSRASALSTIANAGPSTKTTVILTNLHESVSLNSLQDSLKDVNMRKLELQPGCSLHFVEENQAQTVANFLANQNSGLNVCAFPCYSWSFQNQLMISVL